MRPVRVGVVGVGYLGRIHAEKYARMAEAHLVAIADHNRARADAVAAAVGTRAFYDGANLYDLVEAASIVVPTRSHWSVARGFLERGIPLLVEKPITSRLADADAMLALARRTGTALQIGHLERFNPAVQAVMHRVQRPRFIACRRESPFPGRGHDVPVTLDLMIHDIDIVLDLLAAEPGEVRATGACLVTPFTDTVEARLGFADGTQAVLTASRIAPRVTRTIQVLCDGAAYTADCAARTSTVLRPTTTDGKPNAAVEPLPVEEGDALERELRGFLDVVRHGGSPLVSGDDGRRALQVALRIEEAVAGAAPAEIEP